MGLTIEILNHRIRTKLDSEARALTAYSFLQSRNYIKRSQVSQSPKEKWNLVVSALLSKSTPEQDKKTALESGLFYSDGEVSRIKELKLFDLLSVWIHFKFLYVFDMRRSQIHSLHSIFQKENVNLAFSKDVNISSQLNVYPFVKTYNTIFEDYFSGMPSQTKDDLVNDILEFLFIEDWSEDSRYKLLGVINEVLKGNKNNQLAWASGLNFNEFSWLKEYLCKYHYMPTFDLDYLSQLGSDWLMAIFSYWNISEHTKQSISDKAKDAFRRKKKSSAGWNKKRMTVNLSNKAWEHIYEESERTGNTYSSIIQSLIDKKIESEA